MLPDIGRSISTPRLIYRFIDLALRYPKENQINQIRLIKFTIVFFFQNQPSCTICGVGAGGGRVLCDWNDGTEWILYGGLGLVLAAVCGCAVADLAARSFANE